MNCWNELQDQILELAHFLIWLWFKYGSNISVLRCHVFLRNSGQPGYLGMNSFLHHVFCSLLEHHGFTKCLASGVVLSHDTGWGGGFGGVDTSVSLRRGVSFMLQEGCESARGSAEFKRGVAVGCITIQLRERGMRAPISYLYWGFSMILHFRCLILFCLIIYICIHVLFHVSSY